MPVREAGTSLRACPEQRAQPARHGMSARLPNWGRPCYHLDRTFPACRLCKIKYFNNCLFYNVQRNFIAQSGDPTNSGKGGESIWGVLYGEQVGLLLAFGATCQGGWGPLGWPGWAWQRAAALAACPPGAAHAPVATSLAVVMVSQTAAVPCQRGSACPADLPGWPAPPAGSLLRG